MTDIINEEEAFPKHVVAAKKALSKAGITSFGWSASKILNRAFNKGLVPDHTGKFIHQYNGLKEEFAFFSEGRKPQFPDMAGNDVVERTTGRTGKVVHSYGDGDHAIRWDDSKEIGVSNHHTFQKKRDFEDDQAVAAKEDAKPTLRQYNVHPANMDNIINAVRKGANKFSIAAKKVLVSGTEQPRAIISAEGNGEFHRNLMSNYGHLMTEEVAPRTFERFFAEAAITSVTVKGVDNIPRTQAALDHGDASNNGDNIWNGALPAPEDVLAKTISPELFAQLKARFGPDWHDALNQGVAEIPTLQPNHRPYTIFESAGKMILNERFGDDVKSFVFGRQPQEIYSKSYGGYSTSGTTLGPYDRRMPDNVKNVRSRASMAVDHLKAMRNNHEIQGFTPSVKDGKATFNISAKHSDHQRIEASLSKAYNDEYQTKIAERDHYMAGANAAEESPATAGARPASVTPIDRDVHAILRANPDADNNEIGKAFDQHVRSGMIKADEVPKIANRYRQRVSYWQGKGKLD